MAIEFLAMVSVMRGMLAPVGEIARLLESGQFEPVIRMFERAAARLGTAWTTAYVRAALQTSLFLRSKLRRFESSFDQAAGSATESMRRAQSRLVRGFMEEQRRATRLAMSDPAYQMATPTEQARIVIDSIGLTSHQQATVNNYRRTLVEAGKPKRQVLRQSEDHRKKLILQRAKRVAQQEALRAVHEGIEEAYAQAVNAGEINPNELNRTWVTRRDPDVRHSHQSMHGQKRPFGQSFTSGRGSSLRFPADPNAPIEEIAHCRCVLSHELNEG